MNRRLSYSYSDRVFIDSVGDIRAILGIGKSICVCGCGNAIAVFYGHPSGDPNNSMEAYVAYSVNGGTNWTLYGPIGTPPCRRLYHDVDGVADFCNIGGHLLFVWQESTQGYDDHVIYVMIEENTPSAPSASSLIILPGSDSLFCGAPTMAIAPDDPLQVIVTAWSLSVNGNEWAYCWISNDGGYTWSDPIPMGFISQDGSSGSVSSGADDHVFYTYHAYFHLTPTDSTPYPYYMESTDGGYTWCEGTPIPGVPVTTGSQFWWHEFDCLVIDNEPWVIHNDIGTPGGGPYILHGVGTPGNWLWEIWDAGQLGTCSLTIADTNFYCYPSQYPSLSYDPVSNTILASYKAYYYKEHMGTVYYDGAHIGGIYTTNTGATWNISQPLSDANTTQILWQDWNATDVAHRLANIEGGVWSHALWVDEVALALYFEKGLVKSFLPLAINENNGQCVLPAQLHITPSILKGQAHIEFGLSHPEWVEINLYDINGRLVRTIHKGRFSSGYHSLELLNQDLPCGVFVITLETDCGLLTKKFVLMR